MSSEINYKTRSNIKIITLIIGTIIGAIYIFASIDNNKKEKELKKERTEISTEK